MDTKMKVVEDNSLRATREGCELRLRLMWYRTLSLSCIESIQLVLDGQPVEAGALRLTLNGHEHRLEELADLIEEYWFIQDSAVLSIKQPGKVQPGESHQIDLELATRFPYIPIGPGVFLTRTEKYSAVQVAG
jgi:hypothetical protein